MIPDFEENGYLPSGIHRAAIEEILARFGHGSDNREAQAEALQWLLPICRRAGIIRLLINGSFVTNKADPGDVDCVLLQGPRYRATSIPAQELKSGLPYLELKIVEIEEFEFFANVVFGSDRAFTPKGIIEVLL